MLVLNSWVGDKKARWIRTIFFIFLAIVFWFWGGQVGWMNYDYAGIKYVPAGIIAIFLAITANDEFKRR